MLLEWRKPKAGDGAIGSDTKLVSKCGRFWVGKSRGGRMASEGFPWGAHDKVTKRSSNCKTQSDAKAQCEEWARRQVIT